MLRCVRGLARARCAIAALTLAAMACGCAWTNRDNRPVWNAFESHLVPEEDAAFVATLPLTVPGGLVAILADTFVVHPARVVDDAADDALDLWRDLEWQEHYFTELGFLPLRAAATPVVFVGAFLGRSAFDIPAKQSEEEAEAETRAAAEENAEEYLVWFEALAAGGTEPLGTTGPKPEWSDSLQRAFELALARANSTGRSQLYRAAQRREMPPWEAEPWMGLRDVDAVVRYLALRQWSADVGVPVDIREALLKDSSETIRRLAAMRLR